MIDIYTERKDSKDWIFYNDLYFNLNTGNEDMSQKEIDLIQQVDEAKLTPDKHAQYFDKKLEKDTKYQWELSEYLNRDICQPEGFDAYGYPSELFKLDMERLGIIPKRKPAKVIDFTRYIDTNRSSNH